MPFDFIRRLCAATALCTFLLGLPSIASASPTLSQTRSADADLAAALSRLKVDAVSGRFKEEKTIAGFPKPMISTGVFSAENGTLHWNVQSPFPSKMTISAEGAVFEADGVKTVSPMAAGAADILASFLSGRFERLQARFAVDAEIKDGILIISAVPKDDAMKAVLSSVEIRARDVIESAVLTGASGDVSAIAFTDIQVRRSTTPP